MARARAFVGLSGGPNALPRAAAPSVPPSRVLMASPLRRRPHAEAQTDQAEAIAARDREWMIRIAAGDTAAFEALCRAYATPLYEHAFRYVGSEDVARDLVQDVFFAVWRHRERRAVRGTVAAYLYGAVRNAAVSHLRHDLVARRWTARLASEASCSEGGSSGVLPAEEQLERGEIAARLGEALDGLTPRQRLAITLRWQRQLTNAEIAEVMGVSITAVELLFSRAFRTLRERLAGLVD
jgi:RNA polymerase sigma-70 factor (ECF subfamily)